MTTTGKDNVDFKSVINLALSDKIPWIPLKTLLHELTPTFEASRQLNDDLLEELQLIHSKQKEKVELSNETQENSLEIKAYEQETVEKGCDDEEIMMLFTRQKTIGDELELIGNNQIDNDYYVDEVNAVA